MAILGVLLGITMTLLGFGAYKAWSWLTALEKRVMDSLDRIVFLERRKSVVADAVAGQPKPAGVAQVKLRTWNEDAAPFEAKHG
jgi:hypothetical protein